MAVFGSFCATTNSTQSMWTNTSRLPTSRTKASLEETSLEAPLAAPFSKTSSSSLETTKAQEFALAKKLQHRSLQQQKLPADSLISAICSLPQQRRQWTFSDAHSI